MNTNYVITKCKILCLMSFSLLRKLKQFVCGNKINNYKCYYIHILLCRYLKLIINNGLFYYCE